ncbi:hypothetical protein DEU56DRAFT_525833 [Suillus clintonianus]|uniref:uncharacterized protein n=1 Tax=Suillus clintonianus TaxID=1904413 RepID=UPI001B867049|nr:uncharacterized protein DEU56DRAFT_525833 [Suillus clintonianus]KAG2128000.1 hypothetical protein DEU56DRAFT_525833 [Suillus clintonianus]
MTALTHVSRMPYRLFSPSISNAHPHSVSRFFHFSATQKRLRDTESVSKEILSGETDKKVFNLGGYHMSPSSARTFNRTLGINDSRFEDGHLETPINNWLAENKPDVLCGCLTWLFDPRISRVFFFTHFCDSMERPEEDEEDLRVKNWLQENGATGVEWQTFYDNNGFTRFGLRPSSKPRDWVVEEMTVEKYLSRNRRKLVGK